MRVDTQKRLASEVTGSSAKRIILDKSKLAEIKEAITKSDIRSLIKQGIIKVRPLRGVSRSRARARRIKLRKGRQRGLGTRKGKRTARAPKKKVWTNRIRLQRKFIRSLKEKGAIDPKSYRLLYLKAKGGFFRSRRHVKLYVKEQGLTKK